MSVEVAFLAAGKYYFGYYGEHEKNNYNGIRDTIWQNNVRTDNICDIFYFATVFPDFTIYTGTEGNCSQADAKTRYFKKFLPDGHMDTNFRHNTNGTVGWTVRYSDTQLLLSSQYQNGFTMYDTIPRYKLCRIDTSGVLDTGFISIITPDTSNTPYPRIIYPLFIQPDGKIILSGLMKVMGCADTLQLIRLMPNGMLDTTFNNHNNIQHVIYQNEIVKTITQTSDGGYLMGGLFLSYQGYPRKNIVKTDANGFIDTNYFQTGGIDSIIYNPNYTWAPRVNKIVRDSLDRFYIMGNFSKYNNQVVNPIIRVFGMSAGIREEQEKINFTLFPNPATDNITLRLNKPTNKSTLRLYDISGQLLKAISGVNLKDGYSLSLNGLSPGFYVLNIQNETGQSGSCKIIKTGE